MPGTRSAEAKITFLFGSLTSVDNLKCTKREFWWKSIAMTLSSFVHYVSMES